MTDLSWLDAIEARLRSEAAIADRPGQMGRLEGIADDVARLVAAFRSTQGHIEFKAEEIRGLRREVEEATRRAGEWRMKVARVEALARDLEKPFADGVPDREGEYLAGQIRAALAEEDS